MPDFTVTLTAPQATRVARALGHAVIGSDMQQTWQNATPAEVQLMVKDWLRAQVKSYEAAQASATVQAAVDAETW